jgi:hypothetical protein
MRKNKNWVITLMLFLGTLWFAFAAFFLAGGTDSYGNFVYQPRARLVWTLLAAGSAICTILSFRSGKK